MNPIGLEGAALLAKALSHENNKVEVFRLAWSKLGEEGVQIVSQALKHPHNKIQSIE